MQTLTDIQKEEKERQQRAYRFERLKGEAAALRPSIKALEKAASDLEPLRQIVALCDQVPAGLLTGGTSRLAWSIPGGMEARDVLRSVAAGALNVAERKDGERQRELDAARARLKQVEKELQEFA